MVDSYFPWELDITILYLRYILIAGLAYFLFYYWKEEVFRHLKIQKAFPGLPSVIREVYYSFITLTIYAITSWLVYHWHSQGITLIYTNQDKYGYLYFVFSILLMVVLHDTYFYWTHRLMHSKLLYKTVHRIHHLSINPTPFAAFAFHPLEAIISIGIIPVIVFCIPCHPFALFIFLGYMNLINVMGHLGYETFPASFRSSLAGRWLNTATNHNLHHQHISRNYGLYFTFWDRIMGSMNKINK